MHTRFSITILAAFALAFAATAWAQTTHEVHMIIEEVEGRPAPEFYFEPTGLAIEPGDTVRFIADTPHHTVTAWHPLHGFPGPRVPEGVGPFSSPVIPIGESWEYTFDRAGVYDLVCMPHIFLGMAMRIVVGEAAGPGAQPLPAAEMPDEVAPVAVLLAAPELAPQRILDRGSISWDAVDDVHKVLPPFMQAPPAGGEGDG